MPQPSIRRRHLLTGVAGTAALAGVPALSACTEPGGDASDAPANGGRSGVAMPTYVPFDKIPTDYPATEAGGLAAFLGIPKPAYDAITEVPGTGGAVSTIFETEIPNPPALPNNAAWQNLNKVLGVDLQMTPIASGEIAAKLATVLASDDLPDIVSLPSTGMAQLPKVLEAKFTDLTEYLSGDAVKDYPMLAARPESMWRSAIFNQKIFAVPTPNARVSGYLVARKDILDAKGLSSEVSSAEELTELYLALTDAKNGIYADNRPVSTFGFACEMFGAPNQWRVENGTFTSQYLTDEYKDALDYVAQLWKKGVFRPDAFYAGTQAQIDDWGSGRTAMFVWGGTGWSSPLASYGPKDPEFDLAFIQPPKAAGGGKAAKRLGSGVYKLGAIRKGAEPDRVRELLRVMNYIAASYGTAEWLDVYYGAEGDDWTWQEADGGLYLPQRTDRGNAERTMVFYVSGPLFTVSAPGYPEIAKRAYEFMKAAAETGEALPTAGLYSDTDTSRGATWAKDINALIGDIIQGRKQVSDWDELAKRWKADCGDAIAGEYAEALAAANGG